MKNFVFLTSKDNKYLKYAAKLQKSASTRENDKMFVLEGFRIISDAYENNITFDCVFSSETYYAKYEDKVQRFFENSKNCFVVVDFLFEKICETTNPQGILAIANMPENAEIINKNGRYLALDNLSDPSNLGAISRTAEALGVSGIIITKNSCDPYSPKSLRASMGTLLRIPLFICDDIISVIKENNLRSFACVVDRGAQSITDISFTDGDVIIIGNEANGISEIVKELSDRKITIPMKGRAESLNAAQAAAIAAFELTK